jgi:hypothetical protein
MLISSDYLVEFDCASLQMDTLTRAPLTTRTSICRFAAVDSDQSLREGVVGEAETSILDGVRLSDRDAEQFGSPLPDHTTRPMTEGSVAVDIRDVLLEGLDAKTLRKIRTRLAISRIGQACLSSAVSTIGSSVVLVFCTMTVFPKLALVQIIITLLSLLGALVALPAILILTGPPLEPWCKRILACFHGSEERSALLT